LTDCIVGGVLEPLLTRVRLISGCGRAWLDEVVTTMLGPVASTEPPVVVSGLCYDNMPLQACVSSSAEGTEVILIGDPCPGAADMALRVGRSLERVAALLCQTRCDSLGDLVNATVQTMVPEDPEVRRTLPFGAVWLATGLTKRSFALYACASWGAEPSTKWERVARWADRVLTTSSQARAAAESLQGVAIPSSACIEGHDIARARAKIYFRLTTGDALGKLSFLPIAAPVVEEFLEIVMETRNIPLGGLVFSAGFRTGTGELADSKADICCHCVTRTPLEWKRLFSRLAQQGYPIIPQTLEPMIDDDHIELACIGIGRNTRGHIRVNTYWKPKSGLHQAGPSNSTTETPGKELGR